MLSVAHFGVWCVFPFAVRCLLLLFLVFEIESILSQKPKQANACLLLLVMALCCWFWFFVDVSILSIALLVVAFCWYEKPKRATKGKKVQMETKLNPENRQMPFVARYGFLLLVLIFCGCFHLGIALLVVAFC